MPGAPEGMLQRARELLQEYWGHPHFRPGQEEAIEAVLAGRDVLAILPTGGGKSVCYQVPALLQEGLTLVVSPLIALMQDQVGALEARGVPAAYINSTLSRREIEQRWTDAEFGRYRLLYVAPERLQSDLFRARAARLDVALLAVDEAHCVSEWGRHFRPAYREIAEGRRLLGDPPAIAVTATATPEVRRDVAEHLALRGPLQVVRGFDRPNIIWSIFRTEHKRRKVLEVVRRVEGSGLLYAATRRGAEEWAAWLRKEGERAQCYHAGLRAEEREAAQEAWLSGETRLVAATNAFGMGINKPDVRFVIHVALPASLEAYYQQAGRAGRDGKRAYAVLLFQPGDADTQRALIASSHPSAADLQKVYDAACSLAQVPLGGLPEGPIAVSTEAVGRVTDFAQGKVKTALRLLERQGVWQVLPRRRHYGLIRFEHTAGTLRRHAEGLSNKALAAFVQTLLRTVHADAFSDWWPIDLRLLERRTELERGRLLRGLGFLRARGLIGWHPPRRAAQVQLATPRAQRLAPDTLAVERSRRQAEKQLDDLLRYARSVTCRRRFLLAYFGEASPPRCGACDVCLGRHRAVVITPDDEPVLRRILGRIREGAPRADWFEAEGPVSSQRLDGLVDWLVQEGYLELKAPLEETFALTEKAHELMRQWAPRRPERKKKNESRDVS